MTEYDHLRLEITKLSDKTELKDSEVSALMSIVIQTHKSVAENLVKLTSAVKDINSIEKTVEQQQEVITDLSNRVSENETGIKLATNDSNHITESLEEIKANQKAAISWASKIFGSIVVLAFVGGLASKFTN